MGKIDVEVSRKDGRITISVPDDLYAMISQQCRRYGKITPAQFGGVFDEWRKRKDIGEPMKEIVTGGVLPYMTHLMDDARAIIVMRDKRIAELEAALNIIASGFKGDKVLAEWEMSGIAAAAVGVK